MAETRLSDIYDAEEWTRGIQQAETEANNILNAGLITPDARLNTNGPQQAGKDVAIVYDKQISKQRPEIITDNPADVPTYRKTGFLKERNQMNFFHAGWAQMNLTKELSDQDPAQAVFNRIGYFWALQKRDHMLATARGVLAYDIANDSGSLVHDISQDVTPANVTDAMKISGSAIIDAAQTMGDKRMVLTQIAMHSILISRLEKLNLIETIKDSDNDVTFQRYGQYSVVMDDDLPVTTLSNGALQFVTILFGRGCFGSGEHVGMENQLTTDFINEAGNGGGMERIHTRRSWLIHPYGYSLDPDFVMTDPDYLDFADANNWERKNERKNIPIAYLLTNG